MARPPTRLSTARASSMLSRDGGQLLLEVRHGLLARRLHPTPHRTRAHRTATIPAQQSRRRGKRHKDRERTAQPLELPTGPLMGLHSQHLIQRGYLWDVTPVWTPSHTASPSERPEQARELTLGKALTAQRGPTARTGGPGYRPLGTLSEDIFKERRARTRANGHTAMINCVVFGSLQSF